MSIACSSFVSARSTLVDNHYNVVWLGGLQWAKQEEPKPEKLLLLDCGRKSYIDKPTLSDVLAEMPPAGELSGGAQFIDHYQY